MSDLKNGNNITINRSFLLILILAVFSLGIFIGTGTRMFGVMQPDKNEGPSEEREGEFKFIRISLPSKRAEGLRSNKELKPFRYKVSALVESTLKQGEASAISVYFRDLDNGSWFGISEHDKFSPENELKLPLMIAYFKRAESNPLVLRKTIRYDGNSDQGKQHEGKPSKVLEPGKSYAVNDLIFRMIAYDDNMAYTLLLANLPKGHLDKIFKDLNVEYDPAKKGGFLSLSSYASFYRVLFNASYLTEEMSEKALRYLSRSIFREGMVAGIPPNIDMVSKLGERSIQGAADHDREIYQLRESGIIYHPNRPFLLGIVVRGKNYKQLTNSIRDITGLVYNEVDQQLM
jgi:beta-lactamase class A